MINAWRKPGSLVLKMLCSTCSPWWDCGRYRSVLKRNFWHQNPRKNAAAHPPAEIQLAFDMAVQGQLDLDPRDVRCYENFSVIYFATIMRAYRAWASDQARRLERVAEQQKPTPEQILTIKIEYVFYLFSLVNKLPVKL